MVNRTNIALPKRCAPIFVLKIICITEEIKCENRIYIE